MVVHGTIRRRVVICVTWRLAAGADLDVAVVSVEARCACAASRRSREREAEAFLVLCSLFSLCAA